MDEDGKPMPPEKLELWRRNPVDCIKELINNPSFKAVLRYTPEWVYHDKEEKICVYDEMWTGDWWWDTQVHYSWDSLNNHGLISITVEAWCGGDNCCSNYLFRQDSINPVSRRQKSMACLPYNWKHWEGQALQTISPRHHPDRVFASCKIGQLYWSNTFSRGLLTFPFLHGETVSTSHQSWGRGCQHDLCRWHCLSCIPNPCFICCRFSRAVSHCMRQRELLSQMPSGTKRLRGDGGLLAMRTRT